MYDDVETMTDNEMYSDGGIHVEIPDDLERQVKKTMCEEEDFGVSIQFQIHRHRKYYITDFIPDGWTVLDSWTVPDSTTHAECEPELWQIYDRHNKDVVVISRDFKGQVDGRASVVRWAFSNQRKLDEVEDFPTR
jgi:hypothetical protein